MPIEYVEPNIKIPLGVVKNWTPKIIWRTALGLNGVPIGPVDSTNIHDVILTLPAEDEEKWLSEHPFAIRSTSYDTSDLGVKIVFEDLEIDDNKFGFWNAQYAGKYILKLSGQGDFPNRGTEFFKGLPLKINILRRGEFFMGSNCPQPSYNFDNNAMGMCAEAINFKTFECYDDSLKCSLHSYITEGEFNARYGTLQITENMNIEFLNRDNKGVITGGHLILDQEPNFGNSIHYKTGIIGEKDPSLYTFSDFPCMAPRAYTLENKDGCTSESASPRRTQYSTYSLEFNTYLMMKVEDERYCEFQFNPKTEKQESNCYWIPLLRVDWGMLASVECALTTAAPCGWDGMDGYSYMEPVFTPRVMHTTVPEAFLDNWDVPFWNSLSSEIRSQLGRVAIVEDSYPGYCACFNG